MSRHRLASKFLYAAVLFAAGFSGSALSADAAPAAVSAPAAPAAAVPPAKATKSDKSSVGERMRPTGPVTVTATNVDWAKNGLMVYTGNVKLTSDTLNLDGDRLELEQLGGGEFRAKVTGTPAHLLHDGDPASNGAKGDPEPPVTARAKVLIYDSKSGLVDVNGDSLVTRGDDQITGESIHYNVIERRIQAAGGDKGQVRIVIQPPPKDKNAAAPASDAPASTTPAAGVASKPATKPKKKQP